MQDLVSTVAPRRQSSWGWVSRVRVDAPTVTEWAAALVSSALLILAFPDFGIWPLAWIALTPLMVVIARRPTVGRALLLGWTAGTIFFYSSCYWLTYSMIHFGGLSSWLAYSLLVPGALVVGLFPAIFALLLVLIVRRWGTKALLLAPFLWVATEWARLEITGQLWNALGYSQAYHPALIQPARWGGVYAVSFAIVSVNSALAFAFVNRGRRSLITSVGVITLISLALLAALMSSKPSSAGSPSDLLVVAIQPNVPMDPTISSSELMQLRAEHISASENALRQLPTDKPRLVIWPESPMNFTYGTDPQFRSAVGQFTERNRTALLFNSQEPSPARGSFNSAVLLNEGGHVIAQYDKIRLLPFGEYVPVPRWVPGASLITAIVGDFTPGDKYTLMPVGPLQAGVFICIESAYPWIARTFVNEGADVLINISNDGYLGPTAVMRQHLANAIFRAVENGRPVLRVTNSGITAYITPGGELRDETGGFEKAVRLWTASRAPNHRTFYNRFGDVLAWLSVLLSVSLVGLSFRISSKKLRG